MLTIFNRKFLCSCNSASEKDALLAQLKEAEIAFSCRHKQASSGVHASVSGVLSFFIYVNKQDYEKARLFVDAARRRGASMQLQ